MNNAWQKLKRKFPTLKQNIPFSELTTLEIGGPAKAFFEAKTEDELIEVVKFSKKHSLPFLIIGGGSNLLVSDQGFEGLVIKNSISGIEKQGNKLIVKGGTILQKLVDFSIENNLAGLQRLTGIPGTVAGAVYGNAGAYGGSISEYLTEVLAFDGEKQVKLNQDQCQFKYRDSIFKKNHWTILEISFELISGRKETLEEETKEVIAKRLIKYPPGLKCPGSFFKNIVASDLPKEVLAKISEDKIMYGKIPAGALLEEVGAKGDQLGQIKIASNHGNTFINLGGGNALDFYNLAKKYAKKVKEKFRITLEPEVQLINLPPLN